MNAETGPRCATCIYFMLPSPRRPWENGTCCHPSGSECERRIGRASASPYDGNGCPCYVLGTPMLFKRDKYGARL